MKSDNIKERLLPVFNKHESNVLFAYLFGSSVRNNTFPLSDVDIAVFLYKQKEESYFGIKCSLYVDFCRVLKRNDVDVVVLNNPANIILFDKIIREGIVLVDRDSDLRDEYEQIIIHQAIDFKEHFYLL